MSAAPARRPAPPVVAPAASRPALRLVRPAPFRAPRGPFVAVVSGLLTIGLLGVLGLNMLVAQDAFALADLQKRSSDLADREQELLQQVARAESPAVLERRARRLGMVPSENPVFLRLADGAVLGKAKAPAGGAKARRQRQAAGGAGTAGAAATTTGGAAGVLPSDPGAGTGAALPSDPGAGAGAGTALPSDPGASPEQPTAVRTKRAQR